MESKHSKFGLDTHKDLVWINVVSHAWAPKCDQPSLVVF